MPPQRLPENRAGWEALLREVTAGTFTPREIQISAGRVVGQSDPELAAALGIRPATVREYVTHVMSKLDVFTVRQLPLAVITLVWEHYLPPSQNSRPEKMD